MILSGKEAADHIREQLQQKIRQLDEPPGLAVVLLGENPSSESYVNMKRRACEMIGIRSFFYPLPNSTTENELLRLVDKLNRDSHVNGILVQLPLPDHINPINVIEAIDPRKDVDGFHPVNLGKVVAGIGDGFIPCTPLGIKRLLEHYRIDVEGKHVVIVGRSAIVGKPLASLLMQNGQGCNATVTVIHSRTPKPETFTRQADILVAALGVPQFIKLEMVKEGAVVIDVGIHRQEGRLVGDVDFENVEKKCKAITPVPKGVGPMTVAMLLHNTLLAYYRSSV
ncbi:MAG: bifunctional methylenetetrahydrofolate dehydrogenase/methenyltetrahydrofolate cyclohydrolase FolD [Chlamydiales bacterium]|nr:bifunctional methylenetetrahydrofolate dehydrogenase/methenyltetrahydrofolate cyclohydrolase FolD [Chlamydiales bacterium]